MRPLNVVILGAGISGLSLGWFLKKRYGPSISLTILEKNTRSGGWIESFRTPEGFLFENGPRSCRSSSGIETLKLVESLGLQQKVITPSQSAHKRFLYINQKLHPLPTRLGSFFLSPLTRGTFLTLWHEWCCPKGSEPDESVYEFISRRFNSHVAECFADPLVSGIYAGDIRKLSLKSCFPFLYQLEQEYGSILKGMLKKRKRTKTASPFVQSILKYPFFSFQEGMETLVHKLYDQLSEEIILGCEIKRLHFLPHEIQLETSDQRFFQADHLFSTLPSYELAKLSDHHDLCNRIPHTSVAVVNLGWKKKVLAKEGFGYLIPSKEKEEILGVVWNSSVFPQQKQNETDTSLTVMIGGAQKPNFQSFSQADFIAMALRALAKQLHIKEVPDVSHVKLAVQAIPQYLIGHHSLLRSIKEKLLAVSPRMTIMGSSFDGVAVNECIAHSHLMSLKPLENLHAFSKKRFKNDMDFLPN